MPSGAKKRKAAKKKKQEAANNNNPSSIDGNHPLGDDDPKYQDERESDDGDGGSPLSQEHNDHQHPFDEANEVSEKSDLSPIASDVTDNKPADEVANDPAGRHISVVEDDGLIENEKVVNSEQDAAVRHIVVAGDDRLIEIEKEVNSEQDAGSVSTEHVTLHDEVDNSVRSSADVDESLASKRKWEEDAYNIVSNGASSGNEEKAVDSFAEDVTQILESEKPQEDANSGLDVESVPKADLVSSEVLMSEVVIRELESTQVENAEILDVVGSGLSQNEDTLHKSNKVNGISTTAVGPEEKEDKVYPIVDADIETSSDAVINTVIADEGKILTVSDAHASEPIKNVGSTETSETSNVAADGKGTLLKLSGACTADTGIDVKNTEERETFVPTEKECETLVSIEKVTETSISTENQPLVAPAPHVRTSWMSCCGLFDLFAGSG